MSIEQSLHKNGSEHREKMPEIPRNWFSAVGSKVSGIVHVSFSQEFFEKHGRKILDLMTNYIRVSRLLNGNHKHDDNKGRGEEEKHKENNGDSLPSPATETAEVVKVVETAEAIEERAKLEREKLELGKQIREQTGFSFEELEKRRRRFEVAYGMCLELGIELVENNNLELFPKAEDGVGRINP